MTYPGGYRGGRAAGARGRFVGLLPFRRLREEHARVCRCVVPPPADLIECERCGKPSVEQMDRRRLRRAQHLASLPPLTHEGERLLAELNR
jgi:hypothetical protein